MRFLTSFLATVAGNLFLLLVTPVLGLATVLTAWMPPRGHTFLPLARLWSRGLMAVTGVRVERHRDPALEAALKAVPERGYVYLSNHQSLFDIPVLVAHIPGAVRFVAKRSLFRIPFFGPALSAGGFIPVDREDRSRAGETFAAALDSVRGGISVLFFPEGTRSLDGRVAPFQRGGFLLALKGELPIVPVGVSGTLRVQRRGSWWIRPGRVRVRLGAPIETSEYGLRRRRELMADVRQKIAELSGCEPREGGVDPGDEG